MTSLLQRLSDDEVRKVRRDGSAARSKRIDRGRGLLFRVLDGFHLLILSIPVARRLERLVRWQYWIEAYRPSSCGWIVTLSRWWVVFCTLESQMLAPIVNCRVCQGDFRLQFNNSVRWSYFVIIK